MSGRTDICLQILPMDRKHYVSENSSVLKRVYSGVSEYWGIIKEIREKVKAEQPDIVHIASSASLSCSSVSTSTSFAGLDGLNTLFASSKATL